MAAGWTAERYSRMQGGARLRQRGDSPSLPRGLRVVFAYAQGAEKRLPAVRLRFVTFLPPAVILSGSEGWPVDQPKGKLSYGQAKSQLWSTRSRPLRVSKHNPSTQPAAEGGHNPRGEAPSTLPSEFFKINISKDQRADSTISRREPLWKIGEIRKMCRRRHMTAM